MANKGRGRLAAGAGAHKKTNKHRDKKSKGAVGLKPKALKAMKKRVGPSGGQSVSKVGATPHKQTQHTEPTIPFSKEDRILVIGDGDLSFARSLVEHHQVQKLTATVLEGSEEQLVEKYPHVVENLSVLRDAGSDSDEERDVKVVFGIDATKMGVWNANGEVGRGKGRRGGVDRVIFNFPHVGGKSTDVNRQVRYNQELLVNFFKAVQPSLAPRGSITVTLFEGMPYSLWNIRDLARHAGLAVERSFRFQAAAYPGYKHARTIGVVKNREGGEAESAWKGEERPSRSYVFVRREDVQGKNGIKKEVVDRKPGRSKMRGERDSEGSSEEADGGDEDMGTWTSDEEELPMNAGVYDGNNESENEPI